MEKGFCIFLIFVWLLCMTGCRTSPEAREENTGIHSSKLPTISSTAAPLPSELTFSDLTGLEFWFGSGAGAWNTTVQIQSDGTFSGYYHDSEAGSIGDDYPHGTRYECYFSGTFTSLTKVDEYEYSLKCESLTMEGVVGEEKIVDNVRIITSESYGFDNADEFSLYLPGKKLIELPESFLGWVQINPENLDSRSDDVLTFYGLYNVGGEQGFSSY